MFLIVIGLSAIAALLWPKTQKTEDRVGVLETEVTALQTDMETIKTESQSFLSTLIPEDLDKRIANLQEKAENARATIDTTLSRAKSFSTDVFGEEAGTLEERLQKLEMHIVEMNSSERLATILGRFQSLKSSVNGEQTLDQAMNSINETLKELGLQSVEALDENGVSQDVSDEAINSALQNARENDENLQQTFAGVPQEQLKAAALLLGMSQFRDTLNRSNQPFEEDLQLLSNMVGGDNNPALAEALKQLAPQAESGILTPTALVSAFKQAAGDTVVQSLKGENVSFSEKAKARFGELLQVEKDGELITGTDTQIVLNRADGLLQDGKIEEAIQEVEMLDGEAALAVQPWLKKARATLLAEDLKVVLDQNIATLAGGNKKPSLEPIGLEPDAGEAKLNPKQNSQKIDPDQYDAERVIEGEAGKPRIIYLKSRDKN